MDLLFSYYWSADLAFLLCTDISNMIDVPITLSMFLFLGCAPPPGAYDPKTGDKATGGVVDKSERFKASKGTYIAQFFS